LSYREQGYLPTAIINFIALLGWSHPEGKEVFGLEEFLQVMTLDRVQKTGPIFDRERLNWYNGFYIRKLVQEKGLNELAKRLIAGGFVPAEFPMAQMDKILSLVYERLVTLSDFADLTGFFYQEVTPERDLLLKKADEELVENQLMLTRAFVETMAWEKTRLEEKIRKLAAEKNYKKSQYFMMLRVAVTGKTATPPLFETMEVIGKEKTLASLDKAQKIIKGENK
jgi:glutamyl/glutaminyl-tRNA synthetase